MTFKGMVEIIKYRKTLELFGRFRAVCRRITRYYIHKIGYRCIGFPFAPSAYRYRRTPKYFIREELGHIRIHIELAKKIKNKTASHEEIVAHSLDSKRGRKLLAQAMLKPLMESINMQKT